MKRTPLPAALAVVLLAAAVSATAAPRAREPIVVQPCDACELVFDGMPDAPAAHARIAPADEPGEAMTIEGIVFGRDGKPAPGTIVYAYHTDAHGIYPGARVRHGRLRGWSRSDDAGRYRFDTIRPAGYPNTGIPAHVHLHVVEVGRCAYPIDEIVFTDDPRLTPEARRRSEQGVGGSGVVTPKRDELGTWTVRRDIALGAGVAGCPG